jgi:hypothetical protein
MILITNTNLRFYLKHRIWLMRQSFSEIKNNIPVNDPLFKKILLTIICDCRALVQMLKNVFCFDNIYEDEKYINILESLNTRAERMLREKKRR